MAEEAGVAARVEGDEMGLNESRLPALEAALGERLLRREGRDECRDGGE